jgi:uridylate kinase
VGPVYRRILLKLSGEALEGARRQGIDPDTLESVARQIEEVAALGVQLAVVLGGGNLFRGLAGAATGMNRGVADAMGMLATVINGLALRDALERRGQRCVLLSAVAVGGFAECFSQRRATAALEAGEVVILGAGTGNPYFTTDTAAALRALEVGADVLLKATKVDGVYDRDPMVHKDAVRFATLTYQEVLDRRLGVMDLTAITLCRENRLPLVVFDLTREGNIRRVVLGEPIGSRIEEQAGEPKSIEPQP